MDDKGYTFTPLAFLLIIPVVIVAASYNDVVNEVNAISQIVIGGDVTYTVASNIVTTIEKSTRDAGRVAAFNATKEVIDREALRYSNPFLSDSRSYIKTQIADSLSDNVIQTGINLENQTGRKIYVNNKSVSNSTDPLFDQNDITIYQTDPFGFYVNITKGIPITVTQNDQNFTGYSPGISVYVPITGLEDPYIWVNSKDRRSSVIYKYSGYDNYLGKSGFQTDYHFDDDTGVDTTTGAAYLHNLTECLNGNDTGIIHSLYFPDVNGLTFFDRLENKTTSSGPVEAQMSTFVTGDPLREEHHLQSISCLDHEYFASVPGKPIEVDKVLFKDPLGTIFYLSDNYFTYFDMNDNY